MAALETAEARSWRLQQWIWLVAVVCGVLGPLLSYHGSGWIYAFRLLCVFDGLLFVFHVFRFGWPRKHIAIRWLLPLLLFWFVWAVISGAWAIDRSAWMHNVLFLALGLGALGLTALYSDRQFLPRMMTALLAMVVLSYVVAFWENLTGHHLNTSAITFDPNHPARSVHPTVWFHNENDYASFLAILTPWFFVWAQVTHRRWLRWLTPVLAGIGTYFIIATSSRGNILAIGLGVLVFLLLHLRRRAIGKALLSVVVGVAVSQIFVYALPPVQTAIFRYEITHPRPEEPAQIGPGAANFSFSAPQVNGQLETLNSQNVSTRIRLDLIRQGLAIFAQTKGLGVGAGNIDAHYRPIASTTGGITNPHNWWAEVLFNYGILVAGAYVFLYLWTLYQLFLLWRRGTGRTHSLAAALLTGMITFFVASIMPSSFIVFAYQWVVFGLAVGLVNMGKLRDRQARLSAPASYDDATAARAPVLRSARSVVSRRSE